MADKPTPNPALVKIMGALLPAYALTTLAALVAGLWSVLYAPFGHSWIALVGGGVLLLYGSRGVGVILAQARAGSALSALSSSQSILDRMLVMSQGFEREETH